MYVLFSLRLLAWADLKVKKYEQQIAVNGLNLGVSTDVFEM